MQLTAKNIRILRLYRCFREENPTAGGILWASWRAWLPTVAFTTMAGALILVLPDFPRSAAFLVLGMGLGTLLRDFGYARGSARQWPLIKEIFDWQCVDELLDEHERSTGG